MSVHVFFWKDGAALIFFGCFYVSKLLDNVGFCRHIWTKHKKKGHASETSFKDGLIASVPTIRSETPNRTSREFPFLRPTALLLLSTPVFQVGLPPLFLETCLVCWIANLGFVQSRLSKSRLKGSCLKTPENIWAFYSAIHPVMFRCCRRASRNWQGLVWTFANFPLLGTADGQATLGWSDGLDFWEPQWT